jgi:hypothetical protein
MYGRLGTRMVVAAGLVLAGGDVSAQKVPGVRDPFDMQLTAPFQLERDVGTLALGVFETSPSRLQELKGRGIRTVCVVNAGAWENWRPDSGAFDQRLIGANFAGWPGERWLDIRAQEQLRPIFAKRLDLCRSKGFDGVLFRNLDGYAHRTGFPLTAKDQLAYLRWLAAEARARGLVSGLMNTLELVPELVDDFDFALAEGCFDAQRCEALAPFRERDKPAIVIEYTNIRRKMDAHCAAAQDLDLQVVFKAKSLNGKIHRRCP